jgi:hypothetical protein
MESCIANKLNNLCVLYCNLEKKFNDYLFKNETDTLTKEELENIKRELELIKGDNNLSIKGELEEIKRELNSIKEENNISIKRELEVVNGELKIINNDKNYKVKDELDTIKNTIDSIIHELRHQKNVNLDSPNYLEYTTLYADFENCGICMYCPSEPYETDNDISFGPVIDNDIYTNLKNILNN